MSTTSHELNSSGACRTCGTPYPCPVRQEQDNPERDPGYRGDHRPGSFLARRDLRPTRKEAAS